MRVLGLDVGERRVGIAVSDPTGSVARPVQTLVRGSREEDFAALAAIITQHSVELVVVGRPLREDGTEGPQARRVARYARALAVRLPVRVVAWDERFTTVEAEEILREGRKRKERQRVRAKGEVDAVAAAVILQSYLDSSRCEMQSGDPR